MCNIHCCGAGTLGTASTAMLLFVQINGRFFPLFSLFLIFSSFPLPWESFPYSEHQAVLWKAPGALCCQQIPALGIFRLRHADFILWCPEQISAALVDVQSQQGQQNGAGFCLTFLSDSPATGCYTVGVIPPASPSLGTVMGRWEGSSPAACGGPGLAGGGWILHGNGVFQGEEQCCCGHPFVGLGLWPGLEELWGSGIFGFGFVPTRGNGDAFGAHQIVTPRL